MSVSNTLDPQVTEGMLFFDDEEEENTSDETAGKLALAVFDDDDEEEINMLDDEDDDDEDAERETPTPKSKGKGGKLLVTDTAHDQEGDDKKRKRAPAPRKKKGSFPEELRDAYNQLVEPSAFEVVHQDVDNAKFTSRRTNASNTIEQFMQPLVDDILAKVAKNAPFAELLGRIIDGDYDRCGIKNPPKQQKGTKIRDIYTGEIMDEPKSNKEQSYVLLRNETNKKYEGYYMDTQGANIIQLAMMYKFFYMYLYRLLEETITDEQRETDPKTWEKLYESITQGFADQHVHKWTKKKDLIKTGSFVDVVIKAKRTLEALSE